MYLGCVDCDVQNSWRFVWDDVTGNPDRILDRRPTTTMGFCKKSSSLWYLYSIFAVILLLWRNFFPWIVMINKNLVTSKDNFHLSKSGGMGNRTPDLVHAKHALYQLSYTPEFLHTFIIRIYISRYFGWRQIEVYPRRSRWECWKTSKNAGKLRGIWSATYFATFLAKLIAYRHSKKKNYLRYYTNSSSTNTVTTGGDTSTGAGWGVKDETNLML